MILSRKVNFSSSLFKGELVLSHTEFDQMRTVVGESFRFIPMADNFPELQAQFEAPNDEQKQVDTQLSGLEKDYDDEYSVYLSNRNCYSALNNCRGGGKSTRLSFLGNYDDSSAIDEYTHSESECVDFNNDSHFPSKLGNTIGESVKYENLDISNDTMHSIGALKKTYVKQKKDWIARSLDMMNDLLRSSSCRWFIYPVDPFKDGVYDYFDHIERPMDLITIVYNLYTGRYHHVYNFQVDVRQTFYNAFVYHRANNTVRTDALTVSRLFDKLLLTKFKDLNVTHYLSSDIIEFNKNFLNQPLLPYCERMLQQNIKASNTGNVLSNPLLFNKEKNIRNKRSFKDEISLKGRKTNRGAFSNKGRNNLSKNLIGIKKKLHDFPGRKNYSKKIGGAFHNSYKNPRNLKSDEYLSTNGNVVLDRDTFNALLETVQICKASSQKRTNIGTKQSPTACTKKITKTEKGTTKVDKKLTTNDSDNTIEGVKGEDKKLKPKVKNFSVKSKKLNDHQLTNKNETIHSSPNQSDNDGLSKDSHISASNTATSKKQVKKTICKPHQQPETNIPNSLDPQLVIDNNKTNFLIIPPPPPLTKGCGLGAHDKPLTSSQKKSLHYSMSNLSMPQRKAVLSLIQYDLGIYPEDHCNDPKFQFDLELLSVHKQKRVALYVSNMTKLNRNAYLESFGVDSRTAGCDLVVTESDGTKEFKSNSSSGSSSSSSSSSLGRSSSSSSDGTSSGGSSEGEDLVNKKKDCTNASFLSDNNNSSKEENKEKGKSSFNDVNDEISSDNVSKVTNEMSMDDQFADKNQSREFDSNKTDDVLSYVICDNMSKPDKNRTKLLFDASFRGPSNSLNSNTKNVSNFSTPNSLENTQPSSHVKNTFKQKKKKQFSEIQFSTDSINEENAPQNKRDLNRNKKSFQHDCESENIHQNSNSIRSSLPPYTPTAGTSFHVREEFMGDHADFLASNNKDFFPDLLNIHNSNDGKSVWSEWKVKVMQQALLRSRHGAPLRTREEATAEGLDAHI